MSGVISAIYDDGIFKPLEDIHLPDHSMVNPVRNSSGTH
jgi:predicted DNA-binding antitoxin AbrB/MazE fold protein